MKEYFTEGVVLNCRPINETDRIVDIYTKNQGRIETRVIGGRKILSKLSSHLDVLNFVRIRLIQKNRFTLVDVLVEDRFLSVRSDLRKYAGILDLIFLMRALTPIAMPDLSLWHFLVRSFKNGIINFGNFLRLAGYDPIFATCQDCHLKGVEYFDTNDHSFLCAVCNARFNNFGSIYLSLKPIWRNQI